MYYVLVENNEFRGVLDYKPNIGKDNVEVIEYDGIIPKENMTVFEGKLVDKESLTFINGKFIKQDYELEKQQELNKESRKYLNETDWLVLRHQDQLALGIETSLTEEEYLELLQKRQEARTTVVDYKS